MNDLAVRITGVGKSFGSCTALHDARLDVERGEIHALCGENGAGKSTLMRLLSGLVAPDRGAIEVFGRDVTGWSTAGAIAAGVGMVHQHFMLVPTLTVAENVVLGREPRSGIRLDLDEARRRVEKLAADSGLAVPADALVGDLPIGIAQRVEILKVLFRGARVLILDEPTAVLSPGEVNELLVVLRRLKAEGTTIILITHKLDEVMAISDHITVIRRGSTLDTIKTSSTSPRAIARAMVGRDVSLEGDEPPSERSPATSPQSPAQSSGAAALEVSDLVVMGARGTRAIDRLSLAVRPGEVFGIAGVDGNGQTELCEALAGLRPHSSGSVKLDGREIGRMSVRERERAGLAHIAEDRHRRGLVLEYSVADNLVLGRQHLFARRGLLDRSRIAAFARQRIEAFDIRPADPSLPAAALSGGNQQKVVVAREMGHGFEVLLAAKPTRGVDVGAIELIVARLRAAKREGKAILLISSELSEILSLSDRIGVLFRGRLATVLPRGDASAEILAPFMTGATGDDAKVEAAL